MKFYSSRPSTIISDRVTKDTLSNFFAHYTTYLCFLQDMQQKLICISKLYVTHFSFSIIICFIIFLIAVLVIRYVDHFCRYTQTTWSYILQTMFKYTELIVRLVIFLSVSCTFLKTFPINFVISNLIPYKSLTVNCRHFGLQIRT